MKCKHQTFNEPVVGEEIAASTPFNETQSQSFELFRRIIGAPL